MEKGRGFSGNLKPEQNKKNKLNHDGTDHREQRSGANLLNQIEEGTIVQSEN